MRSLWRGGALLGGLGLVLLALAMIAAPGAAGRPIAGDRGTREASSGALRAYGDDRAGVHFFYPAGWELVQNTDGVTVRPGHEPDEGQVPGTMFTIASGYRVPPVVEGMMEAALPQRWAENVAVGGISGTERVFELDPDSAPLEMDSSVATAVEGHVNKQMTVVVWGSQRSDPSYWVIMGDGEGGQNLATLQAIRNSISWE